MVKIPILAVFDLDDTLVKGNMSVQFGWFLLRNRLFSCWKLLATLALYSLYSIGLLPFDTMQKEIFRLLFRGEKAQPILEAADIFCDQIFPSVVRPGLVSELERHKEAGAITAILSSSPDFIVRLFAKKLGVQHVYSSEYLIDENGNFLTVFPFSGREKADALKLLPEHSQSIAYSDSIQDLELLMLVDVPIVVCPNAKLKRIAQEYGWRIFEENEG